MSRNSINLRVKRFLIDGRSVKLRLCSSCLKRIKKDQADIDKLIKESEGTENKE
ncbi:hypothetical protein KA062_01850 [Patescibacteria group bacterium]|nr:hypothetical protein [Patescibacteria group bacterium]